VQEKLVKLFLRDSQPIPDPEPSWQGDLMTLGGAFSFGVYFVVLKRFLGDANNATTSILMTLQGLWTFVIISPILLVLHFSGVMVLSVPSDNLIIFCIISSSICGFFINLLLNFGIVLTSPLFISVGAMICVPGTVVADYVLHNTPITVVQAVGTGAILVGFALLNFDPHFFCPPKPLVILETDADQITEDGSFELTEMNDIVPVDVDVDVETTDTSAHHHHHQEHTKNL
jgi:drug/metabolite transporter (DMT)-like permease